MTSQHETGYGVSDGIFGEGKELSEEVRRLTERFRNAVYSWTLNRSVAIVHYTSLAAGKSILASPSGGIRARKSDLLQDQNEGIVSRRGETLLRLLREKGEDSWIFRKFAKAYITCFLGRKVDDPDLRGTSVEDDLTFWRLYGDEFRGVSLKLPTPLSSNLISEHQLVPVSYLPLAELNLESGLSVSKPVVDAADAFHHQFGKHPRWPELYGQIAGPLEAFMRQRFVEKRADFRMEHEYRYVAFPEEDLLAEELPEYILPDRFRAAQITSTGSVLTFGHRVRENTGELQHQLEQTWLRAGGSAWALLFEHSGVEFGVRGTESRPR